KLAGVAEDGDVPAARLHRPVRRAGGAIGLVVAALMACDAQTDLGYLGEPMVTLQGRVESSGELPPLDAAMLWQLGPPPGTDDQDLTTRAPVTSGFPATFTLRLYQPPPEAAFRELATGAPRWARANAAAVPSGLLPAQVPSLPTAFTSSYTYDAAHWVIFLESDVPASSLTEWWLGAALGKGYHLLRVSPLTACLTPAQLEACVADLVARGVPDDGTDAAGTARGFCKAPYRLQPTTLDETIVLQLGPRDGGVGPACP
ncbi:MAG TPA: hypothetical protein VGK85_11335, partial [Myxococcaceae bacterium]